MAHYLNLVRVPAMVLHASLGGLPRISPLETDSVDCRVLPWDLDFNLHLNNSRYLSYMDYGRIRLLLRVGLLKHFFSRKNSALVGSVDITYRRSLGPGQKFMLQSRIACWDDKWVYMEQIFSGRHGLAAHAWVKTLFRGPGGNIDPQRVLDVLAPGTISPSLSPRLRGWNAGICETLHQMEPRK